MCMSVRLSLSLHTVDYVHPAAVGVFIVSIAACQRSTDTWSERIVVQKYSECVLDRQEQQVMSKALPFS